MGAQFSLWWVFQFIREPLSAVGSPISCDEIGHVTVTPAHTHFNIYHTALGHTYTEKPIVQRGGRKGGWLRMGGMFPWWPGRQTEKRSAHWPSLRRWMIVTKLRESSHVSPSWLWAVWASLVSMRHLALASERHYVNSIKGRSPHSCVSCASPRAQEHFTLHWSKILKHFYVEKIKIGNVMIHDGARPSKSTEGEGKRFKAA